MGQKVKLSELQSMIEDNDVRHLTKEQKDEYINRLVESREVKTRGVRANNVAAARDMTATSDAIIKEVRHSCYHEMVCAHVSSGSSIILHCGQDAMDFSS